MSCWGILYCRFLICLYFFNKLNDFLYRIEVKLLSKSKYINNWKFKNSQTFAKENIGKDDNGIRAEFVKLAELVGELEPVKAEKE